MGDLIIPRGPRFQITKHLNLAILSKVVNFFHGCYEFEVLKVELAPQRMGVPHRSTGAKISNHQTSKFSKFGSKSQIFSWVF
jgi:hypothetical protein